MSRKNLKLGVLGLIIVGFVLMLSGSVFAYTNDGSGNCTCNSCGDCTDALNDGACTIVKLNADIIDHNGTCINNPQNFNNKTFDCQGHKIDGNNSGTWQNPTYGIYLNGKSYNTIKNCVITGFGFGIYLEFSSHNTLTNNTAKYNDWGIKLSSSSHNTLTNNTVNNNYRGIWLLSSSNYNTLTNNTVNNNEYGIRLDSSLHNTLTNNIVIADNSVGIWLYNSSNYNTLIHNVECHAAEGGIVLEDSSSYNNLTNNTACSNCGVDIWNGGNGNTGTNNKCNKTSGWHDNGKTGCTYNCTYYSCYREACYGDSDGDGFGNETNYVVGGAWPAGYVACPPGYVNNSRDCNDANASINPNAAEICNGVDDNCNGQIDEGDVSITNLTFILAPKTQRPIEGYVFDLNISINSTFNTSAELTVRIDGDLTKNITTNLSEGANYKILRLVARGGLHNVSVHIYPQTCDNNLSNNEYNKTYNASTPIILVERYLNNLTITNQTVNISFSGNPKEIMPSPKDNLTLNYTKSLKGLGAKDIGKGKVVMIYKGTMNISSYGNGEISISTPSAVSSDRQSRKVTVRLRDNTNTITGNCSALPQCTFIYNIYNTETIKLDFNNLGPGQHILEYEVNITTDIHNLNYTIHSLNKGNNNQYLQNDSLTQWTPEIQITAQNLTQNSTTDFEKVGKILKWVYENIEYNITLEGEPYNASWVFKNKRGVCAHYTNLFISMCRSIGIPVRGVYGDVYNSSDYLGGHAWAEVFMDGRWYAVDPTFEEIGFIDSGHVSEGYNLSTLKLPFFSIIDSYNIQSLSSLNISYPDLRVISAENTTSIPPIINITPKWRVTNVSGNNVTYEITGIFNNSRGSGYIVGLAGLGATSDPIKIFVGQDKANASWKFSYNYNYDLAQYNPYLTGLTISTDPIPLTPVTFNVYTAATFEIYNTQIPSTIQSGKTAILNVTIRNIGANSGTATVEFYIDNILNKTDNLHIPGISKTNTAQFSLNTASLSQGNHILKFVVKKGNTQQDVFTKRITIGPLTCSNDSACSDNQFCNSTTHQCQDLNCPANQTAFNHKCINCVPFDLDNNTNINIYDVVTGLEHLSEGKSISNEGCTAGNHQSISISDLLTLISRIIAG